MNSQLRIPFQEVFETLQSILLTYKFKADDAALSARLFAETTADGVYSHGLNRFPRYIDNIAKGYIKVSATPSLIRSAGILEVWDGNSGPGNLNAYRSMGRAIELSKQSGTGIVALRNTNHWMRGGSYGWQAANANCIGICFTNTKPNMPPWGGIKPAIGNNPLIIAIPDANGHLVLDMAMSQFAYGKLETLAMEGKKLPFYGGYNRDGELTDNPSEIIETERILPAGYWKGSGLSMMLDLLAAILSGGLATHDIGKLQEEHHLSQVFMAFDAQTCGFSGYIGDVVKEFKKYIKIESSARGEEPVRYPGERVLTTRRENMEKGIPVNKQLWEKIRSMC